MKIEAKKKDFKGLDVLRVNAGALQDLLRYRDPFAYSAGVYGWACDYYDLDGFIVSTGYNPIGSKVDYKLLKTYNDKARAIIDENRVNHEKIIKKLNTLIKDFENDIKGLKK